MTKTATAKLRKKAEQAARAKQERAVQENQERAVRETPERVFRENQKRALREDQNRALTSIEEAANNACERGILSERAYQELIEAGLNDIRKGDVVEWSDAVVVEGTVEPKPVPVESIVISPITASIAESIVSATLSHVEEIPDADSLSDVILPAPNAADTEDTRQVGQDTATDQESSNEPPLLNNAGIAFLHCIGCPRVDLVEYAARALPCHLKENSESPDRANVLVLCGNCRKEPRYRLTEKSILEGQLKSSFEQLSLMTQPILAAFFDNF